jgi:hypothetical protein
MQLARRPNTKLLFQGCKVYHRCLHADICPCPVLPLPHFLDQFIFTRGQWHWDWGGISKDGTAGLQTMQHNMLWGQSH